MLRSRFVQLLGLSSLASLAGRVVAAASESARPLRPGMRLFQTDLFTQLPGARVGEWVRYVMGFGVTYLKQIGFGEERTPDDSLLFVETQIGVPGGTCNPNTTKKAYLDTRHFGELISQYPVKAYVAKQGNMLTRSDDAGSMGHPAARLLLLDGSYLYDPRRCTITSVDDRVVRVGTSDVATMHIACRFKSPSGGALRMSKFEVWQSGRVPMGIVKMRATVPDLEPFTLALDSYGRNFKTSLAVPLQSIRALTPNA